MGLSESAAVALVRLKKALALRVTMDLAWPSPPLAALASSSPPPLSVVAVIIPLFEF